MTKKNKAIRSKYSRLPLLEAVIGINVFLPNKITEGEIRNKFQKLIGEEYQEQRILNQTTAQFHNGSSKSMNFSSEDIGMQLLSSDGKYILQVSQEYFSCSLLNAETSWEDFQVQAKKGWEIFFQGFNPKNINRLAIRYIHRIDIPSIQFNFKEYFNFYPAILENSAFDITGFITQVSFKHRQNNAFQIQNVVKSGSKL